jgi:hypothetical protein
MNLDEARALAERQRAQGTGLVEALVAFEGTGCDWPTLTRALTESFGVSVREFLDIFHAQYESLEPFKRRPAGTSE